MLWLSVCCKVGEYFFFIKHCQGFTWETAYASRDIHLKVCFNLEVKSLSIHGKLTFIALDGEEQAQA